MIAARCAVLVAAALLILDGCGVVAPYPTAPASAEASDRGPRVAICYNTLHTTLAQVRAEAQRECGAGTVAEPLDTDWRMDDCALLVPTRATFACTKK